MTIIKKGGKYKTRSGLMVEILEDNIQDSIYTVSYRITNSDEGILKDIIFDTTLEGIYDVDNKKLGCSDLIDFDDDKSYDTNQGNI